MDKSQIKPIKGFLKEIRKKFKPEKVILFGSRARNEHLKESDFDLLIVSEKFRELSLHQRIVEVLKCQKEAVSIEVICLTPEEFKERAKAITIVREIVKEGIEV